MNKNKIAKAITAIAVSTLVPLALMGNTWNVYDEPVYYTPMETYSLYGGTVYNSGQFTTEESWNTDSFYLDLGVDGNGYFEKMGTFFTFSLGFVADQDDSGTQHVLTLTLDDTIMPCFMLDKLLYEKNEAETLWFSLDSGRCVVDISLRLEKAGVYGDYYWNYTHTALSSPNTLLGANGNSWEENIDMRRHSYLASNLSMPFYFIDLMTVTFTCDDLTEIICDFGFNADDTFTYTDYYNAFDSFIATNGGGTITPPPVVEVPSPTDLLFAPIESFLRLELFPDFTVETLFIIAVAVGVFGVFLKFYAGG